MTAKAVSTLTRSGRSRPGVDEAPETIARLDDERWGIHHGWVEQPVGLGLDRVLANEGLDPNQIDAVLTIVRGMKPPGQS